MSELVRRWPADPRYLVWRDGRVIGPRGGQVGSPSKAGHLIVSYRRDDGSRTSTSVHAMVAETWIGPRPTPDHEAAHWDGDPSNNAADNLRWATGAENMADALRHGTAGKLSSGQVADLVAKHSTGRYTQRALADLYGVSQPLVSQILRGRSRRAVIT